MTVAVTGATGFLGLRLVRELLTRHDDITVLIRQESGPPVERIAEFFRHTGASQADINRLPQRLHPIPIDLDKPKLGLSSEAFSALADDLDVVWHLGGNTSFRPDPQVRQTNLSGARSILELVDLGQRKPLLCHTSSISIAGTQQDGVVAEVEYEQEPESFNTVYERSKFEAERMVCTWSHESDRTAIVFRPSGLIARGPFYKGAPEHPLLTIANTGKNLFELYRAIAGDVVGPLPLPLVGDDARTNLIPVEHAAYAMVEALNRRPPNGLQFYNVVNQHDVFLSTLADVFSDYFGVQLIRTSGGLDALPVADRMLMEEFDFLEDFNAFIGWASMTRRYDVRALSELDLLCPEPGAIDFDYIRASLG
jgi:nucleoside-diphosphate-sugar epimerase